MSKVACLSKTKGIRAENTALGLLLWPLLCCQPGQGNAAFLVSLGLWIWENRTGTTPREPLSYKSRGAYFSVAVYDLNRTRNAPNSLLFLTDFLEGALLERKGDVLKLQSDVSFAPQSVSTGVGCWLGHRKINLFQRLFQADKIPNEVPVPNITESLAQQCLAKSDI